MTKIYLNLFIFILIICLSENAQPYFPNQIVFSPDNGQTIYAIDEINQRAYRSIPYTPTITQRSYVMKRFPYTIPGSAQAKNDVQLIVDSPSDNNCQYATYWKYGEENFNTFPSHWLYNASSFTVGNYLYFPYEMIHSNNSDADEDFWYSNVTCRINEKQVVRCQEIYFRKNTQIPLRFVQVVRHGWNLIQETTNYQIISIGKPDEKYFQSIPKNWFTTCRDVNLGVSYNPTSTTIPLNQSSNIQISLTAPPHRINGNDTVSIKWNADLCNDCLTWTPQQLVFDRQNFHQKQILTITRVKESFVTTLVPKFDGGAFEFVPPDFYRIMIQ